MSERGALLAPDVEGRLGAEAIELVRANGLIAAIETVQSAEDSQQGVVIEQDPPAGTPMLREGVLTLRVAQAPAEAQDTDDDEPAAPSHAESSSAPGDEGEDDTEQWFATLGPTLENPGFGAPGATAPRRRRKHRPAPVPASGPVPQATAVANTNVSAPLDTPPDPLPPTCDPLLVTCDRLPEDHWNPSLQPTACHSLPDGYGDISPQTAQPERLASLIAALLVRLPAFSVSRAWRRRALFVAAVILGVLVFTRSGISHSHHHVPALPLRAASTPASPHSRRMPRTLRGLRISRRRTVRARRPRPGRAPHQAVARASAAEHVLSTSEPSSARSVPVPGPFIYLGK